MNNSPILATQAGSTVKDSYKFQSSEKLLEFFGQQGFTVASTSIKKCRKIERRGFQTHLLKLDHEALKIDDSNKLQVLVKNSHDGSTSLEISLGIYRFVCANGLVVGKAYDSHRIPHRGQDFYERLQVTLRQVIADAPKIITLIKTMQSTILSTEQIAEIKEKMVEARLSEVDNVVAIDDRVIFNAKRSEDQATDLYTVYNRFQEVLVKGGLKYRKEVANANGERVAKNSTTKQIKSIDGLLDLNKRLFDIAESYLIAA
jgi:hypothetical protein